jgi:hypothetical protein
MENDTRENFHFEGKYFETEDEFRNYASKWGAMELNQETVERKIEMLKKTILLHIFMCNRKITNSQFDKIITDTLFFVLRKINETCSQE